MSSVRWRNGAACVVAGASAIVAAVTLAQPEPQPCYVITASGCDSGAGGNFCANGATICEDGYAPRIYESEPGWRGPLNGGPVDRHCYTFGSGLVTGDCAVPPSSYCFTGCRKLIEQQGWLCCYFSCEDWPEDGEVIGEMFYPTGPQC